MFVVLAALLSVAEPADLSGQASSSDHPTIERTEYRCRGATQLPKERGLTRLTITLDTNEYAEVRIDLAGSFYPFDGEKPQVMWVENADSGGETAPGETPISRGISSYREVNAVTFYTATRAQWSAMEAPTLRTGAGDEVEIPELVPLMAHLEHCRTDMFAALRALTPPPEMMVDVPHRAIFRPDKSRQPSYPNRALRDARAGRTAARITIDVYGLVSDCTIIDSSGHADLDRATCRHLKRDRRHYPARDAQGNAIVSEHDTALRWIIPD